MNNTKNKKLEYFNDLLYRLEEMLYHELSMCAHPKSELVGSDFLASGKIEGANLEQLLGNCLTEIKKNGLVDGINYSLHASGTCLKLSVGDCIHIQKEVRLKSEGIEPYCCPIANMILDRILGVLRYLTTYTADIKVDEDKRRCVIKCAVFDSIDKIGQVSDWTRF